MKKTRIKLILSLVLVMLLLVGGVTYAYFNYSATGERSEIVTGQIYMNYADSNTLYLTNIFPETKEEALKEGRTDNEIRFSIKGKNEYIGLKSNVLIQSLDEYNYKKVFGLGVSL